jgi:hypothetical protein
MRLKYKELLTIALKHLGFLNANLKSKKITGIWKICFALCYKLAEKN